MADKWAVYSEAADRAQLDQALVLGKALGLVEPANVLIAPGGSYTIPDAGDGNANASDKRTLYLVTAASAGSSARTIKLPETPFEGSVVIIKCLDAATSTSKLIVETFDGSDEIDGGTTYELTNDYQSVAFQSVSSGPGTWYWAILAEHRPYVAVTQMQWGGVYAASAFPTPPDAIYLPVGFLNDGSSPSINLQYGLISSDVAGFVPQFMIRLIGNTLAVGDSFTFNLRKNGTTQMSLGPYSGATATGTYTTSTGAFSVSPGDLLAVEMAYTALAGTGAVTAIGACIVQF